MQCSWSTEVSSLIRVSIFRRSRAVRASLPSRNIQTHLNGLNDDACVPPPSLTAAQLSRAAAHAIRISCKDGAFEDAFYILNSLKYSSRPGENVHFKIPGLYNSRNLSKLMVFGQAIPSRLSAHCLLHQLLHFRSAARAGKLAQLLMADGVKLRTATLQAVIQAQMNFNQPRNSILERSYHLHFGTRGALSLKPSLVTDSGIRFAISLLFSARQHRQRCSEQAYQSIINTCLMQGCQTAAAEQAGWGRRHA